MRLDLLATLAALVAPSGGAAVSPPMGWNPCMMGWCGGENAPNASLVLTVAEALQSTGLAALGYTTLELDDGWPADKRDAATGEIVADKQLFPDGMAALAVQLGRMTPTPLALGLYTDRGTTTCGGKPGSAGHEAQDAATYIKWGVRQVKSDSCAAPVEHHAAISQYKLMGDALQQPFNRGTLPWNRSVFFSLCGWFNWYASAGVGQSFRVATDAIGWEQLLLNIDAVAPAARLIAPGRWPDMDMISADATRPLHGGDLPGGRGPGSLLARRIQTQFNLIAVTASVLLLSFDPRDVRNGELIKIVSNPHILAVHQDPCPAAPNRGLNFMRRLRGSAMASSAKSLYSNRHCTAGAPDAPTGTAPTARWLFHPAPNSEQQQQQQQDGELVGSFESVARPGWCLMVSAGNGPVKCGSPQLAALMPCGDSVLGQKCGPIDQWSLSAPVTGGGGGGFSNPITGRRLTSVYAATHQDHPVHPTPPNETSVDLTRDEGNIDGWLWLQPQAALNSSDVGLQLWDWNATTGTLSYPGNTWSGGYGCTPGHCYNCVGVDLVPEANTNVWGRSLKNGSWAVVFVNAETADATVRCDYDGCLSYNATVGEGGFGCFGPRPDTRLAVRNLVSGASLATVTAGDGLAAEVKGMGGSVMLLLTPLPKGEEGGRAVEE